MGNAEKTCAWFLIAALVFVVALLDHRIDRLERSAVQIEEVPNV